MNVSDACLLIYDIPERSEVANPSGKLRRVAVRINLSCWVIREGDIPYYLLDEMRQGGATWHVVRFDAAEGGKIVGMAIAAMKKELKDAIDRARAALEAASQRVQDGRDSAAEFEQRVRANIRRHRQLIQDLTAAAQRFGIDAGAAGIGDAATAVACIQTAMVERARLYADAARRLRQTGTSLGAGMAAAAEGDRPSGGAVLHAGVMADVMDENGVDGAAALRDAFGYGGGVADEDESEAADTDFADLFGIIDGDGQRRLF